MNKYLVLAVALLLVLAAQAFAVGTLDYNNIFAGHEKYHDWAPKSGVIIGDDVHRTTSDPIVGVDLIVFNHGDRGNGDVDLYIYSNADDTAGGAALLATYEDIAIVSPGHGHFVHYDLPAPLAAPADLWIGIQSDNGWGIMPDRYEWNASWSLGVSHSLYFYVGDDWGGFNVEATPGYPEWYNLGIATYSAPIPEPGSLLALSTGLMGLLALRRRR